MSKTELEQYKQTVKESYRTSENINSNIVDQLQEIKRHYEQQQSLYLTLMEQYGASTAKKIMVDALSITQKEWEAHYSNIKKINKHNKWSLPLLKLVGIING